MGIFDNEETFLTAERDKLNKPLAVQRRKDNPFRSLGAALKMWNTQHGEGAQQAKDKEILMRQIDMDKVGDLNFAIKELQSKYGDREGAVQLINIRNSLLKNQETSATAGETGSLV